MLILLLGAFLPNTLDGTIAGNPITKDDAAAAFAVDSRNTRLEIRCLFFLFIPSVYSTKKKAGSPAASPDIRQGIYQQLNRNNPFVYDRLHKDFMRLHLNFCPEKALFFASYVLYPPLQ
jgi:hypothetical protein